MRLRLVVALVLANLTGAHAQQTITPVAPPR
jgi:hypothetical protein